MKLLQQICVGLLMLTAAPLWSQVDNAQRQPTPAYGMDDIRNYSEDRMLTPPTVSGQSYPEVPTSLERSNYLQGGVTFSSAYSDNVLGTSALNSAPVSDVNYSVWPTLALDETTSRLHSSLTYAPGFTFYQHTSSGTRRTRTRRSISSTA